MTDEMATRALEEIEKVAKKLDRVFAYLDQQAAQLDDVKTRISALEQGMANRGSIADWKLEPDEKLDQDALAFKSYGAFELFWD